MTPTDLQAPECDALPTLTNKQPVEFDFDFDMETKRAMSALKFDPNLSKLRYVAVPRQYFTASVAHTSEVALMRYSSETTSLRWKN